MPKNNFILLSLDDKRTNKVANVVSNASCKKILDYLAEHEGTETEISKKLSIALSTVHYNLQQLKEAGLIEAEEYHYSEKGKEVYHWKLANKYIIIAPKKTRGIASKLKGILPVGLIALGTAFVLQFAQKFFGKTSMMADPAFASRSGKMAAEGIQSAPMAMAEEAEADLVAGTAEQLVEKGAAKAADEAVAETARELVAEVPQVMQTIAEPSIFQNIGVWFFIGALFALVVYAIISYFRKE